MEILRQETDEEHPMTKVELARPAGRYEYIL
jgi:hypothetical protein